MSVIRLGPLSVKVRPRLLVVSVVALTLAVVIAVVSLGIGDFALTPMRVVEVILGGGTPREELIVSTLRLPRAILALVIGAALGISGAIVQTTARNALASPDLLGVTSGASAGAVAVIVLGGTSGQAAGLLRSVGVPIAAVVGGLAAAALVALVLRVVDAGGVQPILVGVGVSAFFGGLVSWMMIAASIDDAARANVWLTGSLNGRSWPELTAAGTVTVLGLLALVPLAPRLATLSLGPDIARSLGLRPLPAVVALLVVAVVLVSVATAVAGPIAFVALVAPHLARMASRAPTPPLFVSAALGALIVAGSDIVARTVLAPILLPVGAVTAAVGAPFLLWLLVRGRKASA
ncbi:iron chelate uptake ABC transporter family permease subunit [Cryobacterium sp. SO2]|uniref:FecCD family ABC transporter permease n=1 Tax=Cryobacterium sp. SO2 TaxID=1897060 RepID=UPI00223D7DC9|nr:iron chelate uptake ABC transporter family permease subunit [Cryobacterium sp. SO2]WEO78444.1 iron chelate uptake ABC transporter family permease subunit [Cryobacterium sp. SO2]